MLNKQKSRFLKMSKQRPHTAKAAINRPSLSTTNGFSLQSMSAIYGTNILNDKSSSSSLQPDKRNGSSFAYDSQKKLSRPVSSRLERGRFAHPTPLHPSAPTKDVVIHVFDEARNVKRDFHCKRSLLLREMKYFQSVLEDERLGSMAYEIDVHSDIQVFEWLMEFCTKQEIQLSPQTAISILISSNFLQMQELEKICLKYMHDNINEIVQVPIDFNCMNGDVLKKLVDLFEPTDIYAIEDSKDKIKSQLYLYKIQQLLDFKDAKNPISKCQLCDTIYVEEYHSQLECLKQLPTIDHRGNMIRHHVRSNDFNINDWVVSVFLTTRSWEKSFWQIWGHLKYLKCQECLQLFPCIEYYECCKHPQAIESDQETCTTCESAISKFTLFDTIQGCVHTSHIPIHNENIETKYLFDKFKSLIVTCQDPNLDLKFCTHERLEIHLNKEFFDYWNNCLKIFRKWDGQSQLKLGAKQFAQRDEDSRIMKKWIHELITGS
ncbi:hypothetical protein BC833DRAFT_588367 [Globomyces pollinis-pini]|nr:hypothetical protein BC833DRAFT_588367 [Globomyces pollinis-pini]